MCVFNRPSPPPLPKPQPIAPRPEPTARRVVVGQQRTRGQNMTPRERRSIRDRRRTGTASLRIPLLTQEQTGTGNLRY